MKIAITGIEYPKNRIHTFGCSLTSQHNWRYLAKNNDPTTFDCQQKVHYMTSPDKGRTHWKKDDIHLTDYSISGLGNDIQRLQYANEVYYNNISKDDIILWQISSPDRVTVITEDSRYKFHNVFTGEDINLVHTKELSNTTTYNTLWQLNGIKRNNDKLLVMFGWDSCFERGINQDERVNINETTEKNEIIKFLKEHDIDYIEESILGWSTRHKFFKKGINDDIHPPQEGYKSFTEECLLPKLKKLKWLD